MLLAPVLCILTQPFKDSHSVYHLMLYADGKGKFPDILHKRLKPLGDTVPPEKSIPKQYPVNQEVSVSPSTPLYCHNMLYITNGTGKFSFYFPPS